MFGPARRMAPILAALGLLAGTAAPAHADPACAAAIAQIEPASGLPPGLLLAIALVETGRAVPGGGGMQPWPWSWNAAGRGGVAPTRAAAVAAVGALRAGGVTSVDVGCMQINLMYHPNAFASLEEAFDPVANVRYAAAFLSRLRAGLPDWEAAIRRYHSGDAARGEAYQRRVALARLGEAWRGGTPAAASIELPPGDLCAPGARLVLVLRGTLDPRVRRRGARMVCLAPPRR
ncbi:lytic transglycosylase domain-containing protein [Roseomonas sp. F4]